MIYDIYMIYVSLSLERKGSCPDLWILALLLSLFFSGALPLLYAHSGHGREAGVIGSSLGDTGAWDLLSGGNPGSAKSPLRR